jgi:Tol biopolymer transport system component/DNA-binding winged helix-turn-helix (wHTH) protein
MSVTPSGPDVARFAEFELDLSSGELWKNGTGRVPLPDQPFRMLAVLIRRPGTLVTRDDLRRELWSEGTFVDFEHSLNAAIKRLREALGDSATRPRFIETLPRHGYRFIAALEERPSPSASSSPETTERRLAGGTAPEAPPRKTEDRSDRRWIVGGTATVVLLSASLFGSRWLTAPSSRSGTPSTAALVRLTSTSGLDTEPALSPDGTLLAFASDRGGGDNLDIWVQRVDGGEPLRLTSDAADETEPSFSRDGGRIVFSQRNIGICVTGTMGGGSRLVVRTPWGRTPRFSPDGRWIAYWTGFPASVVAGGIPGALGSIFVAESSGGSPRPVETHLASARYPVWSPDGQRILFLGEEDPDQKTYDWYIVKPDGGDAIKTGAVQAVRAAGLHTGIPIPAAWRAEGDDVVFATNEADSSNLWQLAISPSTGRVSGPPQRLTFGTAVERSPTVANSGRIAFTSIVENVDIWRVPLDADTGIATGAPERLTDDAASDRLRNVSADGRTLAFISSRTSRDEVWLKDLQTGREHQLTHGGTEDASMSKDGSKVTFSRSDAGARHIEIVDTDAGVPSTLCQDCDAPSDWSRDGKRLLFGRGRPSRLLMYDFPSGRQAELVSHSEWSLLLPRFSPDGRWVAFHTTNSPNVRQIYSAPVTLNGPTRRQAWVPIVVDHGCHPDWSSNGSRLYYFSSRDGAFCPWVQEVDPATSRPLGVPRAVRHFHQPRLQATSGAAAFNDVQAGYLYLSLTESTGNIWMLDDGNRVEHTRLSDR